MQQPTCEATADYEMRYPFRMAASIGDGLGGALRKAQQNEPVKFSVIDDRFEIGHPFVERNLYVVSLRQTNPARVVSQQRMLARATDKKGAEDRTLQIVFEMGEPCGARTIGDPLPIME